MRIQSELQLKSGNLPKHSWEGLESRLFLPQWWSLNFEAALLVESGASSFPSLFSGRLLPACASFDLNVLSLIISYIQKQLLFSHESVTNRVVIDLKEVAKEYIRPHDSRRQHFERLLLSVGGLKVLQETSQGSFSALSLFAGETWLKDHQDLCGPHKLELTLSPWGPEFFLGLCHGYEELYRGLERELSVRAFLGKEPPLLFWRSVWLDLQGIEQALLLRLERSMQWSYRCLQLEGVFGESLERLFQGLKVGPRKLGPSFTAKRTILQRLGKKLLEHGFFQNYFAGEYLAYDDKETGPQLVWKLAPHRFLGEDLKQYLHFVSEKYIKDSFCEGSCKWSMAVGAGLSDERRRDFVQKLGAVLQTEACTGQARQAFLIEGNVLVPYAFLFLEWTLRNQTGSQFPLSEEVKSFAFSKRLARLEDSEGEIGAKLAAFIGEMTEVDFVAAFLESRPGATYVAKESQSLPEFEQMVDLVAAQKTMPRLHEISRQKDLKDLQETREQKSLRGYAEKRVGGAKRLQESLRVTTKEVHVNRKVILEELQKLKNSSKERYFRLLQSYLRSLDEASRRLILDLQQRMQPETFEKHLHQRLIQFVVEHPSEWQNRVETREQEGVP